MLCHFSFGFLMLHRWFARYKYVDFGIRTVVLLMMLYQAKALWDTTVCLLLPLPLTSALHIWLPAALL